MSVLHPQWEGLLWCPSDASPGRQELLIWPFSQIRPSQTPGSTGALLGLQLSCYQLLPACQVVPYSGLLSLPLPLGQLFPPRPCYSSKAVSSLRAPAPLIALWYLPLSDITSVFIYLSLSLSPPARPAPGQELCLSCWQCTPSTEQSWVLSMYLVHEPCSLPRALSGGWPNLPLNPGHLAPVQVTWGNSTHILVCL